MAVLAVANGGIRAGATPSFSLTRDTYRFVFMGSLESVATFPPDGGSATDVWTTKLRWTLVYRVTFDSLSSGGRVANVLPHAGGLCGYPFGPGLFACKLAPGSNVTGSSVGVQNPGGPDVEPGCLNLQIGLASVYGGFTLLRPSAVAGRSVWPTVSFLAPTRGLIRASPAQCVAPLQGSPSCTPHRADGLAAPPELTLYDGPIVTIPLTRVRQAWSVHGACNSSANLDFHQDAHWSGTLTATRLSRVKMS